MTLENDHARRYELPDDFNPDTSWVLEDYDIYVDGALITDPTGILFLTQNTMEDGTGIT